MGLAAVMDLVQHQLGETHQAMGLAAVMDLVQHQLGETHLIRNVLAQDGTASF
jgi:hypothetical protein